MSATTMKRSARITAKQLDQLEGEFRPLLLGCLRECARGRWGLFGQNDHLPDARWLSWPEAKRLSELAQEINAAYGETGTPNELWERFLTLCSLRGSNIPGETKLAAAFLVEIGEA